MLWMFRGVLGVLVFWGVLGVLGVSGLCVSGALGLL